MWNDAATRVMRMNVEKKNIDILKRNRLTKRCESLQSLWKDARQVVVEEIELAQVSQTIHACWDRADKVIRIEK